MALTPGKTAIALLPALAALAAGAYFLAGASVPDFDRPAAVVTDSRLAHPGDIIRFKGRYVVTELRNNRLAVFDELPPKRVEYFDPTMIGKRFKSPHFLAVTDRDTLLISNGWGRSIVEIADLEGGGWREFSGVGQRLHAPHGICVDDAGWIYVGDSLNSRLVRFRDMAGADWQVFADHDKRISYIRELACRDGVVWISNSYENREGLNPGTGSNVLKITDYASGRAEEILTFPDTNITGVLPLDNGLVLVGQWALQQRLALADLRRGTVRSLPRLGHGTPYGTFLDSTGNRILVTYIGDLSGDSVEAAGAIGVYR